MANNFENNAFTNFAPLLTLFGDEATKQFLATSMGVADSILLGIAPIGLITVIVSAIRVGGNRFMKSLVGRARESPDDEEKEILSSTSVNVREIWDGYRVVRQTGPSRTVHLVFNSDSVGSCLRRLEGRRGHEDENYRYGDLADGAIPRRKTREPPRISDQVSPNLAINIPGAIPSPLTVLLLTFVGVIVQMSAMAFNAVVVYYWKWLRAGNSVASYGYPTWAAGTVCISLGTSICGWVVERSTRKFVILPTAKGAQILLYQKRSPEQGVSAYAISPVKPDQFFKVSQRSWPPTIQLGEQASLSVDGRRKREQIIREVLTAIGTVLALCGFICQNIGTRELHWSAGVYQLGVTLILAMIRSWLRRHVGDPPGANGQDEVVELADGFESSHLTTKLTGQSCFILTNGNTASPGVEGSMQMSHIELIESERAQEMEDDRNSNIRIISSILETQSLLQEVEPDGDGLQVLAAGCYAAIEEVLNIILQPKAPSGEPVATPAWDLYDLGGMFYLVTIKPERLGKGIWHYVGDTDMSSTAANEKSVAGSPQEGRPVIAKVRFPGGARPKMNTSLLQAMMGLTLYAHRHKIVPEEYVRDENRPERIYRVLGHCDRTDVGGYIALLKAWTGADEIKTVIVPGTHIDPAWRPSERVLLGALHDTGTLVFGLPFSHAFSSSWAPSSRKSIIEYDLVLVDELDVDNEFDIRPRLVKNIAIELFTSFFLQLVRSEWPEVNAFIGEDPDAGCETLAEVLMRHGVCSSRRAAKMAIVPTLILTGLLSSWPAKYRPPAEKIMVPMISHRRRWRRACNDKQVLFMWDRYAPHEIFSDPKGQRKYNESEEDTTDDEEQSQPSPGLSSAYSDGEIYPC